MAEKKQESFTVTDRRLFTPEGEVRRESSSEERVSTSTPAAPVRTSSDAPSPQPQAPQSAPAGQDSAIPPAPTAAEQKEQADAYLESSQDMDKRVEMSGRSARDLEMTFERFLASLYMTAMMQLGLMQEEGGQPRLDIIGARQTIDTISLLSEKTKGNLTSTEANFLQNALYELRMAYVEVTNALSRPPQTPASGAGSLIR
ncbi:MAG: hypothetical protein JWO91_2960 [Acidobacteriaceae bacterium]|jgi:hypothetical protein|nr:hypothetical protein [Acidobacteriaceae bacterium]